MDKQNVIYMDNGILVKRKEILTSATTQRNHGKGHKPAKMTTLGAWVYGGEGGGMTSLDPSPQLLKLVYKWTVKKNLKNQNSPDTITLWSYHLYPSTPFTTQSVSPAPTHFQSTASSQSHRPQKPLVPLQLTNHLLSAESNVSSSDLTF